MTEFSKIIFLPEKKVTSEFLFHELKSVGEIRYGVTVRENNGDSLFFNMERRYNGSWKIINAPKLPNWILSIEKLLQDVILEKTGELPEIKSNS
jgi:hypothetical protein